MRILIEPSSNSWNGFAARHRVIETVWRKKSVFDKVADLSAKIRNHDRARRCNSGSRGSDTRLGYFPAGCGRKISRPACRSRLLQGGAVGGTAADRLLL